jgi:Asp-tRNA(Asn)/Glu-tRNA(Gln) amidotransferase C subunit
MPQRPVVLATSPLGIILSVEAALSNAPAQNNDLILVPKIVE